ncbi:MAG: serine hydrolase [Candidatus Hydrogenedentes bacterium]|nr:serine hydrolase [Candidatus Hydrogenedentota bacterium]
MRLAACCVLAAGLAAAAPFAGANALPEGYPDRQTLLEWFQDSGVEPEDGNYIRLPNAFPVIVWKRPLVVHALWGHVPIAARWFDRDLEEVARPDGPGRYDAYIEARAEDGRIIRRGLVIYCLDPDDISPLGQDGGLSVALPGVAPGVQDAYRDVVQGYLNRVVFQGLGKNQEGAMLLAGLTALRPEDLPPGPLDAPHVRHIEHQLALKRSVQGPKDSFPPLDRPKPDADAPELRPGPPEAAGMKAGVVEALDQICRDWVASSGGEPFTAVVARKGVVVFHRAYGEERGDPVTQDTTYPLHSITKSVTGVLLALFLDQGLLTLDTPLGEILPSLPKSGPHALTIRHCMTHTSGLDGHGVWGGLNNVWLDSVVADGIERLEPGRAVRYNGVSFDLVGRVLEAVTGKSAPRIFHEYLFEPLGAKGARITDMGLGADLRAIDLARIGQLLLNEGAYGEHRFFSEDTFAALLPRPYAEMFPALDEDEGSYGIGIRWASRKHPQAGENGIREDALTLSESTIGHGAFSSTVFRVDLERDLVIAIGRMRKGDNLDENLDRFLASLHAHLDNTGR